MTYRLFFFLCLDGIPLYIVRTCQLARQKIMNNKRKKNITGKKPKSKDILYDKDNIA